MLIKARPVQITCSHSAVELRLSSSTLQHVDVVISSGSYYCNHRNRGLSHVVCARHSAQVSLNVKMAMAHAKSEPCYPYWASLKCGSLNPISEGM